MYIKTGSVEDMLMTHKSQCIMVYSRELFLQRKGDKAAFVQVRSQNMSTAKNLNKSPACRGGDRGPGRTPGSAHCGACCRQRECEHTHVRA